jgi:hypothetical protein
MRLRGIAEATRPDRMLLRPRQQSSPSSRAVRRDHGSPAYVAALSLPEGVAVGPWTLLRVLTRDCLWERQYEEASFLVLSRAGRGS